MNKRIFSTSLILAYLVIGSLPPVLADGEQATPASTTPEASTAETPAKPVAKPAVASPWLYGEHVFRFRITPGTDYKIVGKDRLELKSGELLVEPNSEAVVATAEADTYIRHHAAVLFRVAPGSTRCMVLWDNGSGSTALVSNQHRVRLGPGDEALACDHHPGPAEIYEGDAIGRRRIKLHIVGAGKAVSTSEFSLLEALEKVPLLYEVFRSPDPEDKALKDKILKTAAVLNMVTGGHGYYSSN